MIVHTYPRILIRYVPESHVVNEVLILTIETEQLDVTVGLHRYEVSRSLTCLTTRELQLTTHFLIQTDVKLSNLDVLHQFRILLDSLFHLRLVWSVRVVVTLHTNTCDWHTCILHLLHHVVDAITLSRLESIVVIINEDSVRICLMSELESLSNELITTESVSTALTIRVLLTAKTAETTAATAAIRHGFVHNVPSIHNILIAVHHSVDVLTKTLVEHFLGHFLTVLVGKHPVAELRVPTKAVTTHLDTVLTAEVSDSICILPSPLTLSWMNRDRLHVVLSRHTVVILLNNLHRLRVVDVTHVHCNTHGEVTLVSVLVTLVWVGVWIAAKLSRSCQRQRCQNH